MYRSDSVDGNGFFYKFHRPGVNFPIHMDAYEAMSDFDTGVIRFGPDSALNYVCFSTTYNTSPRSWIIIGDKFGFYLMVRNNYVGIDWDWTTPTATAGYGTEFYYFGDFPSLKAADAHNSIVTSSTYNVGYSYLGALGALTNTGMVGHLIPADSKGDESLKYLSPLRGTAFSAQTYSGANSLWDPEDNPFDDIAPISRIFLNDSASHTIRGFLPGYYFPFLSQPYAADTVVSIPYEPDLQLLALYLYTGVYAQQGQCLIDLGEGFRP